MGKIVFRSALLIIQFLFLFSIAASASGVVQMRQNRSAQQRQALQQAAYQQANQQVVSQQILQQKNLRQQQVLFQQAVRSGKPVTYLEPVGFHSGIVDSEETMQMSEILADLEYSSEMWDSILDSEAKAVIVSQYIQWYRQQDVRIEKNPERYVSLIDSMTYNNRTLLKQPFKNVIKIAAIMEYDFDNGQNKDTLAKQFLGDNLYLQNKKRLGL